MTEKLIVTEKPCTLCKVVKPAGEFYKHNKRRDGLQTACIECTKRTNKTNYESDKDAWHLVRRDNELRKKFGISLSQWLTMYEQQGKVCLVCKQDGGARRLHVDHDHATGKVRGLLCGRCNIGLGYFLDNSERLRAAADYLEAHNDRMDPNDTSV